ncbi:TIGR04282 family arsenosugar biosynthesis glycosyltransferase [Microbispora amethystogenes]|uniref:TIGR04282 family arsenosugar biosynthesis glycosyltransferase n=1 Tax=Microbispora amethystogenes TaxID=1427754 RepID=UPI001EF3C7ED|nr:TIGR04282 family arsenosugar biosynthesis glycosyltransferase [Microbispora amethystogenes]
MTSVATQFPPQSPPQISPQVIVIAKEPRPGRVKTRLTPPYTPSQAAVLAEAALRDTLAAVAAAPAARRVLALLGEAGPWLPAGYDVVPQRGDGLAERLTHAFDDARSACPAPAVLIGMDTPQVTPGLLAEAGRLLDGHDVVVGPAADGGFWLLGQREPDPALLSGLPMSRSDTGALLLRRIREAGLRTALLPELTDVDTAADARAVAERAPSSRFAAVLASLGAGVPA